MRKLILLLMLIAAIVAPVLASNSTEFRLPYVSVETPFKYKDNIFTELKTEDPANAINWVHVDLKATNNSQNGVTFTVGPMQYTGAVSKQYYLWLIPYGATTCFATLQSNATSNYTLFQVNGTTSYWDSTMIVGIRYDDKTGLTSFECDTGVSANINTINMGTTIVNSTKIPVGMPAGDIIITAGAPFDVDGSYYDFMIQAELKKQKESLSPVTSAIYWGLNKLWTVATFGFGGELTGLIPLLQTIDMVLFLITVMASTFYTYPYLIGFWILIFGNIYSGYLASTPKDVIRNLIKYYGFVFSWAFILVTKIIELAMWVLRIIRG